MRICHEQIYQALYVQGAGSLRSQLRVEGALRTGRARRVPRSPLAGLPRPRGKSWIQGATISLRPPQADDRAVPGHWEADPIIGGDPRQRPDHSGGASQPVRADHPSGGQPPHPHRHRRPQEHDRLPAPGRLLHHHLGSGRGDGQPRRFHPRHRHQGLLRRSPQPLAASHQREHQRPDPRVPPQGHRLQQHPPTPGPGPPGAGSTAAHEKS